MTKLTSSLDCQRNSCGKQWYLSLLMFLTFNSYSAFAIPIIADTNYQAELFLANVGAPTGMKFNSYGELYFTDYSGGQVLRVTQPNSTGLNTFEVYATGIPYPTDLTFNSDGRLFVTSSTSANSNILEILPNGSLSVFSSGLSYPTSINSFGNDLFVANSGNGEISKINSSGVSSVFLSGFSQPSGPFGISISPTGNLYFVDHQSGNIYTSTQSGQLTLLNTIPSNFGATFTAYAPNGDLFISDAAAGDVYRLDSQSNDLTIFASGFAMKSNPPFIGPAGLVFDNNGNLFVGDGDSVYKISSVIAPISPVPEPETYAMLLAGLDSVVTRL